MCYFVYSTVHFVIYIILLFIFVIMINHFDKLKTTDKTLNTLTFIYSIEVRMGGLGWLKLPM